MTADHFGSPLGPCALPNLATSHFQIVPLPNCINILLPKCATLHAGFRWRGRLARGTRGRGLGTRLVARCRAVTKHERKMSQPQKTDFRRTFGSIPSRDIRNYNDYFDLLGVYTRLFGVSQLIMTIIIIIVEKKAVECHQTYMKH